jgi:hydroxysqualene synthase
VIHRLFVETPQAARAAPRVTPPAGVDVAECFRYCEALARARHHNFPVASRFLPEALRPHVFSLYAFVRGIDEIAAEPRFEGRRSQELDRWEDHLIRAFHGEAEHPVFVALGETARRLDLPVGPLLDLVEGFRVDLRTTRYATVTDLTHYLQLAAVPLGRVMMYAFGVKDIALHRYADELSTALALTSFVQDISRDAARGRIYLPVEDLHHFGVPAEDIEARRQSRALAALVRHECARTRAHYLRARPLVDLVPDSFGIELGLCYYGGLRALARIEARAHHVFENRARLSTVDKAWALAMATLHRGKQKLIPYRR